MLVKLASARKTTAFRTEHLSISGPRFIKLCRNLHLSVIHTLSNYGAQINPFHKATTGIVYTSVTKHICVVTVIYQVSYKLQFHVNTDFLREIIKQLC